MLRRSITGQLEPRGAFIDTTIMATHFQVSTMKMMGLVCPAPVTVRTLIDTGASGSVLDPSVISQLNLTLVGSVLVHTPSTGSNYATINQYDASIFLVDPIHGPTPFTVGVLESHLASEGFLAILGWDILSHCILTCDGPAKTFRLDF